MSRHNRRCEQPSFARRVRPPLSTCPTGKIRFPDHRAAVSALHKAATERNFARQDGQATNRHEVRSYSCKECNGWHLTSQPKRDKEHSAAA